MRENRTYGSEGGEAGQPAFPTPIALCGDSPRIMHPTEGGWLTFQKRPQDTI